MDYEEIGQKWKRSDTLSRLILIGRGFYHKTRMCKKEDC